MNKKLEDIEKYFDLPYDSFYQFVIQDDLVCETEKEIADLVINYIKIRRNLIEKEENESREKEKEKEKKDKYLKKKNKKKKNENDEENLEENDNGFDGVNDIENEADSDKEKNEEEDEKSEENDNEKEKSLKNKEDNEDKDKDEDEDEDEDEEEESNKAKLKEKEKEKEKENSIKNILTKWNINILEQKNKTKKVKLTKEEERKLIECIRISNLSHSDLISLSIDPLFADNKDLILYGLSLRLNNYEATNKLDIENNKININPNPRNYIRDQNKYLDNYTNFKGGESIY